MKVIQHAFVVIHIRISHVKILKIKARDFATAVLVLLLLVCLYRLITFGSISSAIFSIIYCVAILYISVFWIVTWPIANKLLNHATDMEYDVIEKEISNFSNDKVKFT